MARLRPQVDILIAVACLMTLPESVHAHGLSSEAARFIVAFVALALVMPTLADYLAIRFWLRCRGSLAAILGNLVATTAAIPFFLMLQWLSSAAATTIEARLVHAAFWLRTLSPWPEALLTIAGMAVMKAMILSWRSREPFSQRTVGLLFLSTVTGMCVAAAVATFIAYAMSG